jgi:hypothetical protein
MPTLHLSRYSRDPNYTAVSRLASHQITDTSLAIIETIYRYRFIPTSLILRLVGRDPRNLYYHLQALYQKHQLINRLTLFSPTGWPEEFVYFLDTPRALELLCERGGRRPDELDFDRVIHSQGEPGEDGHRQFVRHELMITRLHAMLELATAQSAGKVVLHDFRQGAALHRYVSAPKLATRSEIIHRRRQQVLFDSGEWENIPHRPDAFFTLFFPERPEGKQYEYFFYEADRKTTDTTRMKRKLRGHFHFIVKRKLHQVYYQIPSVRAVLIETIDSHWAETLRQSASDPVVSGAKPSNLFWFAPSDFFIQPVATQKGSKSKSVPFYYEHPEVIFSNLWFSPNDRAGNQPRSILDP